MIVSTGTAHIEPLLNLIKHRFDICLATNSAVHLRTVVEHYEDKRRMMLFRFGEAFTLARPDYAKAVLISETAKLILREIDPPKKKKKKKDTSR